MTCRDDGAAYSLPVVRNGPREHCGVVGIWGEPSPAHLAYMALYALQHRGQESAGLAATDGRRIERIAGMGLVPNVFDASGLESLDAVADARRSGPGGPTNGAAAGAGVVAPGLAGGIIGHNRYSTTGASHAENAQPFVAHLSGGPAAVAHNGNLTNAASLRSELERGGRAFATTSDTEVVLQRLASRSHNGSGDPLAATLADLEGAFSLVFLFGDRVEAARDRHGWRPLVLGRLPSGAPVVASETVALDVLHASYVREVEPGEIVTLSDAGESSRRFAEAPPRRAHCVFEHVYFASPASTLFGRPVQIARETMGARLADEAPVEADVVVPMPDSGRSAATGFARASGLPYREAIIPNRYVGRTFIRPTKEERVAAVRLKLNVVADIVRGKRVVIVDDSIVRGTTTRAKMDQLRSAGAAEIHLRISCPPIRHPCYFGVDFPDREQLVAHERDVAGICALLGVDSLAYLSLEGLLGAVAATPAQAGSAGAEHYCTACYSGEYPIAVHAAQHKHVLAKGC